MNEFDQVLTAMERLNARDNPVTAKRLGRELDLTGKETGYLLRRMHADGLVVLVDLSFKKWRL